MKTRLILGHVDCPTCALPNGMRITLDKNGEPFGYCEAGCGQQMRIGGDAGRVHKFTKRYPWAADTPVTVTIKTETVDTPVPAKTPVTVTVPEKPPEPSLKPKPKTTFADGLKALGVLS